jgi:hypothetical protein
MKSRLLMALTIAAGSMFAACGASAGEPSMAPDRAAVSPATETAASGLILVRRGGSHSMGKGGRHSMGQMHSGRSGMHMGMRHGRHHGRHHFRHGRFFGPGIGFYSWDNYGDDCYWRCRTTRGPRYCRSYCDY